MCKFFERDIRDLEQTLTLGRRLGAAARPGDVIVLCGDLGAGKTQLTKGIAQALGVKDAVASPTFNIVLEYHDGRMPLYHFDLYRLEYQEDLEDIGFYEILEAPGDASGLVVIEWGDKFPDALPEDHLELELQVIDETERHLLAKATGLRSSRLMGAV